MITIHWDYTDGTEVSYIEGRELGDNFTTCCLEFFNQDMSEEVVVRKKDGSQISLKNIQEHTTKEIRDAHDVKKMLMSGLFNWKK